MKNHYQNELWIAFREEVIELDGFKCTKCGKTRESGAILQVHHKEYIKDKALWEYPLELCETLCKGCHASEHGIIRPEDGWDCVGEEDLGGLYGTCERCGTQIRYIFHVQHIHWEPIVVGTVCCDDLTGTQVATDRRKFGERLNRFYKSKRWKNDGDDLTIKQKQIEIRIIKENKYFKVKMGEVLGIVKYPTINDAKRRIFEFIESGDADEFFKGRSKKSK